MRSICPNNANRTTASCAIGSSGVRGVDADRVGQVAHPDPARGQVVDQVQGVAHGAAEPVQGVHHDHVPVAGVAEQGAQPGPVGGGSGLLVHEGPLGRDPHLAEGVQLPVEVLFRGRHPRIPEIHRRNVPIVGSVAAFRHAVVDLTCETPRAAAPAAGRPRRAGVPVPRLWDVELTSPARPRRRRSAIDTRSSCAPGRWVGVGDPRTASRRLRWVFVRYT